MKLHYLDNAATTAVLPAAAQAAGIAMTQVFGNPSSLHRAGTEARELLEASRKTVAGALGVKPDTLYFTGGGSESINTALRGAARKNKHLGRHIISTLLEHDAVLNTLAALKTEGWEITLLAPRKDGNIHIEDLQAALRPDTVLVSMMGVNNETGAVLPYAEAARLTHKVCPKALFHLDGVQTFCKAPLDLKDVDLASFSAHKIGGTKGCGALYIRAGLTVAPLILGGGQEKGQRSGTEGLPQIAAFAEACRIRTANMEADWAHMRQLKTRLLAGLESRGVKVAVNSPENGAPHVLNLSPCKGRSEVLIRVLSDMGVCVSGGSACSKGKKSHVLTALGLDAKNIDAALRVSLCPETTEADIDAFCDGLKEALKFF